MAQAPTLDLTFNLLGCPDCGTRAAALPRGLPPVGDDFQWGARDFDGLRQFMLEELAARFPERERWTPADVEVVLVEVLAAVLDQLSDMADRVAGEAVLETARRPGSVRRLLSFIGYDAFGQAAAQGLIPGDPDLLTAGEKDALVEALWRDDPHAMELARREGPQRIFDQERMVTLADYAARLDDHPLVVRANAASAWGGSWEIIRVAVILPESGWRLDQRFSAFLPRPGADPDQFQRRKTKLMDKVTAFHSERGLPSPDWTFDPTPRMLVRQLIDAQRMAGQAVELSDAVPVGIALVISLVVRPTYYQSEVRGAAAQVLSAGPEGFFAPGKLSFGEDVFASDLIAALMGIAGVENVCLIRFKRVGAEYPDRAEAGSIQLDGLEVAVCDNEPGLPERGYYSLILHGGSRG